MHMSNKIAKKIERIKPVDIIYELILFLLSNRKNKPSIPARRTDKKRPIAMINIFPFPVPIERKSMPRDMNPMSIPRNIWAMTIGKPPYGPYPIMKNDGIIGIDTKRLMYIQRKN